jgi:hypothetical protein
MHVAAVRGGVRGAASMMSCSRLSNGHPGTTLSVFTLRAEYVPPKEFKEGHYARARKPGKLTKSGKRRPLKKPGRSKLIKSFARINACQRSLS